MAGVAQMQDRVTHAPGFFAALDQSGGSTPDALRAYGVPDGAYANDEEMFRLMHAMRARIVTAPAFTGERIVAAILFVRTMDGEIEGAPAPAYLWRERGIAPFVKIDEGLEAEADGVQLMKPVDGLDDTLARALRLEVCGAKARSVIRLASPDGVEALVAQQFELAERVAGFGLLPIVEPEILIKSPQKAQAEALLHDALRRRLDRLPPGRQVLLKLTPPEIADRYLDLAEHGAVARLLALSGGYPRDEACRRLAQNHRMIASFSRALIGDLRRDMSDAQFDAALAQAIAQIYAASTIKAPA